MKVVEAAQLSNQYAQQICSELLPNGVVKGGYFKIGSVDGEAGQSLAVYLNGPRQGRWVDNATDDHGDMLDLIQTVSGFGISQAITWVADRYGSVNDRSGFKKTRAEKEKILPPLELPERCEPTMLCEYLRGRGFKDPAGVIAGWDLFETHNHELVFTFSYQGDVEYCKRKNMKTGESKTVTGGTGERYHFYGWDLLDDSTREVLIVEGELDAIAAKEMGFDALSLPQGAGKGSVMNAWQNDMDRFDRFERVYIATDQDAAGDEAAEHLLACIEQSQRMRWDNHKDLNDILLRESDPETFVKDAIAASWSKPQTIVTFDDIAEKVRERLDPERQDVAVNFDMGWSRFASIDLKFRKHDFIILGGENGGGKSLVMGMLCLQAIDQGSKVCIASFEMPPEVTTERLVRQVTGVQHPTPEYQRAASEWLDGGYFLWNDPKEGIMADISNVLEDFEYIHRRFGVDVFVLDSLTLMTNVMDSEATGVHNILTRICDFKRRFPVTIFLITHVRKGDQTRGKTGKDDIKGAGTITDLADTVLMLNPNKKKRAEKEKEKITRQPADKDLMSQPDLWVECVKNRNGSFHGAMSFNIHDKSLQMVPVGMPQKKFFNWSATNES